MKKLFWNIYKYNFFNIITKSNNEAECIGKALKNIKKFEEVDFSYMKLTNLGFNKIIEGINPENLKVLNISGIVLTQENVLQLSNTILNFTETKTNISSLIAYSCNIGDDGVKTLCSNLSKDGCILKSLDLRDNNITETGFVYIAGMLTVLKKLKIKIFLKIFFNVKSLTSQ